VYVFAFLAISPSYSLTDALKLAYSAVCVWVGAAVDWDNTATPQFQASVSLPHVHVRASPVLLALIPAAARGSLTTLARLRAGTRARLNALLLLLPHPYPGGMGERARAALAEDALALLPSYVVGVHVAKVTASAFQNGLEMMQVHTGTQAHTQSALHTGTSMHTHTHTYIRVRLRLSKCPPAYKVERERDRGAGQSESMHCMPLLSVCLCLCLCLCLCVYVCECVYVCD
jgi:hypothetical protein